MLRLRMRLPADDARIVALYTAQEADGPTLTVEAYREEHGGTGEEQRGEQWVAVGGEAVVGYGGFSPAWWTGDPTIYLVSVRVDRSRWGEGAGRALLDRIVARLVERRATRLLGWVREDSASGRSFAARHGFSETGKVIEEYRLHVPEATTGAYAGVEERLRQEGIRTASLAELGPEDESLLRELRHLWSGSGEPEDGEAFASWRQNVLEGPGQLAETHWIALDGTRPVGTSFLKRLSEDAAENDFTTVAPSHRGRGIGGALKLRAIAWARANGVDWFYTSSETGNTPMIGINRRLGYVPGARRMEIGLSLPRAGAAKSA